MAKLVNGEFDDDRIDGAVGSLMCGGGWMKPYPPR